MILISDIGNTSITVGLFDKDKKINVTKLESDKNYIVDNYGKLLSEFLCGEKIDGAILSSVYPEITETYKRAIKKYFNVEPAEFSHKTKTNLKIITENKSEVGADRIVNAISAVSFYKLPAIVVDFGTATTFDIVNEKGEFIGGIIMPGLKIQAKALCEYTSKLPLINIKEQSFVIGTNTKEAMLSGILRGHMFSIEGLLKECKKELRQKPTVIATGGYAKLASKYLDFDFIDEDLTLKGLNKIYYSQKKY